MNRLNLTNAKKAFGNTAESAEQMSLPALPWFYVQPDESDIQMLPDSFKTLKPCNQYKLSPRSGRLNNILCIPADPMSRTCTLRIHQTFITYLLQFR
jgi:hypothetical protein